MAIAVGVKLPSGTLRRLGKSGIEQVSTDEIFGAKKVVLFAVPGAFTPTCNDTHFPGFMVLEDKLREKGADEIVCMAVNDPFVTSAWAKSLNAPGRVEVLSDGNGDYAATLGLTVDLSGIGLGTRAKRFALIAEDGVVKYLGVEPGREVSVSSAEAVLENL
jgi:peroxiredoxin